MSSVHVYTTIRTRPLLTRSTIGHIVDTVLKDQLSAESIINVHIIGHTRMQTLNTLYRGISAPTDVLSFETGENWSGEGSQELGDIFICQPYIITQANRFGVTPREEMIRMLVHGTLHLLGYDHEKQKDATRMFALQESYVETCRIVTK